LDYDWFTFNELFNELFVDELFALEWLFNARSLFN